MSGNVRVRRILKTSLSIQVRDSVIFIDWKNRYIAHKNSTSNVPNNFANVFQISESFGGNVRGYPSTYFRPPYGVSGWVGVELGNVDDQQLAELIHGAFRFVNGKKADSGRSKSPTKHRKLMPRGMARLNVGSFSKQRISLVEFQLDRLRFGNGRRCRQHFGSHRFLVDFLVWDFLWHIRSDAFDYLPGRTGIC